MRALPKDYASYKQTPVFDEKSIPQGLLNAHQTKSGTWGKIIVLEGQLMYRILDPKMEEYILDVNRLGIVEPEVLHEVEPMGKVSFYVDFYRSVDASS